MEPVRDPVADVCNDVFGIPYPFPWQRLIITAVLDALDESAADEIPPLRRIAVLPTGAGKSLCWMLPAVLADCITVAVFPLLSLMADQLRRLTDCGIRAVLLKGGQSFEERRDMWSALESGKTKIILANPEVLQNPKIEKRLSALKPQFLTIDETHTVSQWGETFRPACAGMGRLVEEWNPRAVLALTATAGPDIRSRITELLFNGKTPEEALADPDRPALRYGVIPSLSRFHTLEKLVHQEQRPLMVFGSSRPSVEQAARVLRFRLKDPEIRFYHAGLSPAEKARLEAWFMDSDNGILCATCAYGMGVDKKNIRTVVHLSPPSSVEAYLQESGRASRDGLGANAWLIWTPEDAVGDLRLDSPKPPGVGRSGEAAPEGDSGGPTPPTDAESIAKTRRAAMICYSASTDRCRREMLLESLGIEAQDCTGCDVCGGEAWTEPPEQEVILKIVKWNRGRFRKGQLARILIGRRTAEIRRTGLDLVRGFGALAGWELEDAEEAIGTLKRAGEIRTRKWLSRGNIYLARDRKPLSTRDSLN